MSPRPDRGLVHALSIANDESVPCHVGEVNEGDSNVLVAEFAGT
jgi:hypothetical protein